METGKLLQRLALLHGNSVSSPGSRQVRCLSYVEHWMDIYHMDMNYMGICTVLLSCLGKNGITDILTSGIERLCCLSVSIPWITVYFSLGAVSFDCYYGYEYL